jgi:hypothetical protein
MDAAVEGGFSDIQKALRQVGGSIKGTDARRLVVAVKAGDLEQMQRLLAEGVDVNEVCRDYTSPILTAFSNGALDIVRAMVAAGARLNGQALENAAMNDHLELLRYALSVVDASAISKASLARTKGMARERGWRDVYETIAAMQRSGKDTGAATPKKRRGT